MAAADTTYTARFAGPEWLVKGRANVVSCPLYRDGALVAPTQAGSTLTILRPDGTALVGAQPVTVASSIATYSVGSSVLTDEDYREGYAVEWSLLVSGTLHRFRRAGLVCRSWLYPAITDADLIRRHSDLADQRPSGLASYQPYIDEAWADLCDDLRMQGNLPQRVLSGEDLRRWLSYRTLVLIFRDFRVGGGVDSKWAELQAEYEALAKQAFASIAVVYDSNEDGVGAEVRRPLHATTFLTETSPVWGGGLPWGR